MLLFNYFTQLIIFIFIAKCKSYFIIFYFVIINILFLLYVYYFLIIPLLQINYCKHQFATSAGEVVYSFINILWVN